MNNHIIELPVTELKTAVMGFNKIIPKTSTLPVLQCVRLSRSPGGIVSMQATDLDSFATYQLEVPQSGEPCEFLVPLEVLNRSSKGSARTDQVGFSPDGKESIKIHSLIGTNRVEHKVGTVAVKEWPTVPPVSAPTTSLPLGFGPSLKQALECASDDPGRYVINGVCLDVTDKKAHYVVGTDGRVLFSANSFQFDFKESLVLPGRKFLGWPGFMEEQGTLAIQPGTENPKTKVKDTGWVQLKSGRWTYLTRPIDGNYPNWKQIEPRETPTKVQFSKESLDEMLQVIPKLPGDYESNYPIDLVIKNEEVVLSGRDKDQKHGVDVVIKGPTVTGPEQRVSMNRYSLIKALRWGMDQLAIADDKTPVVFSKEGKKLIIALLRPDAPTTQPPAPTTTNPATTTTPTTITPPATTTEVHPQERNTMPKNTATSPAPETTEQTTPMKTLMQKLDTLREGLKAFVRDLGEATDLLKQVDKEQKVTAKEIEGVREKLRDIQSVKI